MTQEELEAEADAEFQEKYDEYDRTRERMDENEERRTLILAHYQMVNRLGFDMTLEKAAMRYREEEVDWTLEQGFIDSMYRPLSDLERLQAFAFVQGYSSYFEHSHPAGHA